ncbi:MAG: hypothetical protein ACK5UI_02340 [Bacteroidota bacterium]|jgi:hypothetical protein
MPGRFSFIILFLFSSTFSNAQSFFKSKNDSIAFGYNWYGQYKTTLQFCDSLIELKLGYYELYLTAAYAANQLKKPLLEQGYLLKAQNENPQDTAIRQLLIINHIQNNQYHQAVRINNQLKKIRLEQKLSPIHLIHTETGIKLSNNDSLYKPLYYQQIGIGAKIGTVIWYNAITHISQQAYYGDINQWQYYSSAQFSFAKNWNVISTVHLLSFKTTNVPELYANNIPKENPWATSITVSKSNKNFTYTLGTVYSKMNKDEQLQFQPQITWWPFYNNRFMLQTGLNYLTENNKLQTNITTAFRPIEALNITCTYAYLNAKNFTEQNAYLVNNSFDFTLNRFQMMASYEGAKGWSPYLFYQLETKEEFDFKINYQLHMIMAGVRKTL